ncbi:hereditary hemochromatosis protein homolog isoform X2 [Stegostoma tigrinum]|uniref:hereditary hemochromatosis protein homolog isoform X2 n=1 Tax=Stegostoma tigrinum TaxID=3053191 RepID=UPI00286FD4C6|nr:hereditary hemochromatosis protein homolog isoform X2 [Stegostoma tigrinum]
MPALYQWALLTAVASVLEVTGSSGGLHILHVLCDCVYREQRTIVSWEDAYDGATIMYYDLANKSFVATQPFAQGQADRRNSNGDFVQSVPQQIGSLCEKIKQTAILTHVSQRQIAPTSVRAFMEERAGQRSLLCEVRNFFPADITVSWLRDGAVVADSSETVTVVPQRDRTYQAWTRLTLRGDMGGSYFCQVEHQAITGKVLIPLGCSRVCVNPTAKFTSRGGVPCRSNLCNSSVRSSSSDTSNTSTTSADNLTKTHA